MPDKELLFIFYILIFAATIKPQTSEILIHSTDSGISESPNTVWELNSAKKGLLFFLKTDEKFESGKIFFFLDKKKDDNMKPYDAKIIKTGSRYIIHRYDFKETGTFRAEFSKIDHSIIAEKIFVIVPDTKSYIDEIASFSGAAGYKMKISPFAVNGDAGRNVSAYRMAGEVIRLFVRIESPLSLNADELHIQINSKKGSRRSPEINRFRIKPGWKFTNMRIFISQPGDFVITVIKPGGMVLSSQEISVVK